MNGIHSTAQFLEQRLKETTWSDEDYNDLQYLTANFFSSLDILERSGLEESKNEYWAAQVNQISPNNEFHAKLMSFLEITLISINHKESSIELASKLNNIMVYDL